MLRTVSGSRCRGVGDPVACGMCRFLGLISAGAFMPVLVGVSFPVRAIVVCMFDAGCRDRRGFHYIAANGAFLMLRTISGSRCRGVDDPFAGGMSCFAVFNDDATTINGTNVPMIVAVGLPLCSRSMLVQRYKHAAKVSTVIFTVINIIVKRHSVDGAGCGFAYLVAKVRI